MKLEIEFEDHEIDAASSMLSYLPSNLDEEEYYCLRLILDKILDKAKENGWRIRPVISDNLENIPIMQPELNGFIKPPKTVVKGTARIIRRNIKTFKRRK